MTALAWVNRLMQNLFRRRKVEQDLDAEVRSYFEMLKWEKIRAGLSAQEAERAARLEMGGVEQVKEEVRSARSGASLDALAIDLRYAARMLRKSPGFTAAAVLTLALGIGANTAIFTVLNAVVLRPLPYRQPDRLAMLWTEFKHSSLGRLPASGPQVIYFRERSRQFEDLAGIWVGNGALTGAGEPEQMKVGQVTENFFSLLGTNPQFGRTFLPAEQGSGAPPVILLSDALWRRRFGADPGVVGQTVQLDGAAVTVVGVMPKDFEMIFPSDASVPPDIQAWTPFGYDLMQLPRGLNFLRVVGRLRPGVTIAQAQAEARAIAQQLRAQFTEFSTPGVDMEVVGLQQDAAREIRPTLVALFGGVGMILLIACANVANLLLARATVRHREITVRAALGATRSRIVRQLLTESILLSCLGGAAGLATGWWGLKVLLSLRPGNLARVQGIHLDFSALGFTIATALGTGILFGLAPVFASAKVNLTETLKEGGRSNTTGKHYLQRMLVVSEVALGLVLLIGATLMIRTFARLLDVDPGFRPEQVLTFQVAPAAARYPTDESRKNYFRALEQNIAGLPGVESVGASSHLPFDDYPNWYEYYWKEGATAQEQNTLLADHRAILPGYFRSMGAPIIAGRDFDDSDDSGHPDVAVVDESLARRTWPNADPLGKKLNVGMIHNGSFERVWAKVIGVVKHIKYEDPMKETRGQVYVPYLQSSRENLGFTVRTAGDPRALIGPIRREMDKLDKDIPLSKPRLLAEYLNQARAATRFATVVSGLLAGIALLLASLGIYAVSSYAVAQRSGEVGIRMALGAQRGDILKLVLHQGMIPVVLGVLIGLVLSLKLTPLIASLLFGVSPIDPATLGTVSLVLTAVGLLACYLPARRAAKLDPLLALRYE